MSWNLDPLLSLCFVIHSTALVLRGLTVPTPVYIKCSSEALESQDWLPVTANCVNREVNGHELYSQESHIYMALFASFLFMDLISEIRDMLRRLFSFM